MKHVETADTPVTIAVDTGGTFTDVLGFFDGEFRAVKLPSTPENPAVAVLRGVELLLGATTNAHVIHGSTVATNTLLQRQGAKVALITNRGFRDMLAIGRQNRAQLYSLKPRKPEPLVPEELCFELDGRMGADGTEVCPLDLGPLEGIWAECVKRGVRSIVVSFLHSDRHPAHETQVVELLRNLACTENMVIDISCGSELLPEIREVERTTTAVVNAYVRPVMDHYLGGLEQGLSPKGLRILLSNGGVATPRRAALVAVQTLLSGPAGGVIGATEVMRRLGVGRFITFDMGGTSTDVALCDDRIPITHELDISGFSLRCSGIDIHTVGAGGGSISYVDGGGALRVGPTSAGAYPGPACYGRGGKLPTVTDANLVCGLLLADRFLGGAQQLDGDLARQALIGVAETLGATLMDTAYGIRDVANAVMVRALKVVSVARGLDPKEFTLVTFGGAGGLHACDLAELLRIRRVIVPRFPGLLCAMGMLFSDIRVDVSRTVLARIEPGQTELPEVISEVFGELVRQAEHTLYAQGVSHERQRVSRAVDVRYVGQSFEITVPFGPTFAADFAALHRTLYGFEFPTKALEIITARVVATAVSSDVPQLLTKLEKPHRAEPLGVTSTGRGPFAVYRREEMAAGAEFAGPAIVAEYSATTVVPERWRGRIDGALNLDLEMIGE